MTSRNTFIGFLISQVKTEKIHVCRANYGSPSSSCHFDQWMLECVNVSFSLQKTEQVSSITIHWAWLLLFWIYHLSELANWTDQCKKWNVSILPNLLPNLSSFQGRSVCLETALSSASPLCCNLWLAAVGGQFCQMVRAHRCTFLL